MLPSLQSVLKRDRWIVGFGLVLITLLAWAYLFREAHAMTLTGICCCAGMKMSGPDLGPWSGAAIVPLFLMWAEMMVAMMLPSATPMILTFAMVNRKRREREQPWTPSAIFVLGYLLIWTSFSFAAALAQWALHGTALMSDSMVSASRWLAGVVLISAGVFQWTPLKRACLSHCRSPLNFLMTDWREGKLGALFMGLKHGTYCTGCCWLLMAILFVAGVMNIWWVAAITVWVVLEKLLPRGERIGKVAGVLLVGWGLFQFFL
jgi:predicted metal-binding membrane protein